MREILKYSPVIKDAMETYLNSRQVVANQDILWEKDFLKRLQPFSTSGKLLRGSLVCFSYEAFSGQAPDDTVINTAVAVELTHSALLIHDDVMDGDELRRGRPAMHRQYQTLAEQARLASPPRIGANLAIGSGDATLFMAFDLLPPVPAVRRLYIDQLIKTCTGQMQDIFLEASPTMPTKREIMRLMQAKTAAYTAALPLMLGAALAGQPKTTLRQLQRLGSAAGTIYQIRDDELGALGDSAKTGKPVGADIREGKKTLLYYYLMQHATAEERQKLQRIFGNPDCSRTDISYAQQLFKSYRIAELLDQEVAKLEKQSVAAIKSLPLSDISKNILQSLVIFCADRQY